jgi:ribosome recycling factor
MVYDLSPLKNKLPEIKEWLKKELSLLTTGRASPALLDNIAVDYYGAKQPLKHVGAISAEDARTLRIRPWDSSLISQIDQAIRNSSMGLQAIAEKDSVRVIFPELTQERRKALLKTVSEKLEQARISLRKIRDEYWREIQDKEREGKISEDNKYRLKDELQELIDEIQKKLEEMAKTKEKEIGEK